MRKRPSLLLGLGMLMSGLLWRFLFLSSQQPVGGMQKYDDRGRGQHCQVGLGRRRGPPQEGALASDVPESKSA